MGFESGAMPSVRLAFSRMVMLALMQQQESFLHATLAMRCVQFKRRKS